jgi:hypothetical protein
MSDAVGKKHREKAAGIKARRRSARGARPADPERIRHRERGDKNLDSPLPPELQTAEARNWRRSKVGRAHARARRRSQPVKRSGALIQAELAKVREARGARRLKARAERLILTGQKMLAIEEQLIEHLMENAQATADHGVSAQEVLDNFRGTISTIPTFPSVPTEEGDGSYLILDDPHNVKAVDTEQTREEVLRWYREKFPGAGDGIVVITDPKAIPRPEPPGIEDAIASLRRIRDRVTSSQAARERRGDLCQRHDMGEQLADCTCDQEDETDG